MTAPMHDTDIDEDEIPDVMQALLMQLAVDLDTAFMHALTSNGISKELADKIIDDALDYLEELDAEA